MTLIITYANSGFSICVSDRLTTVSKHQYDPQANKVIVARLQDALLTIGYTGPAYIDGRATDEWLVAQVLQDIKGNCISFGSHRVPKTTRLLTSRIIAELQKRATRHFDLWAPAFELGICGTRSDRGLMWPYILRVSKPAFSGILVFKLFPRLHYRDFSQAGVWVSGGWAQSRPDVFLPMYSELAAIDIMAETAPEDITAVLKLAFRGIASEMTIGDEIMVVSHTPYRGYSTVEFFGNGNPHVDNSAIGDLLGEHELGFSPWIIGNKTAYPPSGFSQESELCIAGYPIRLKGGWSPSGMIWKIVTRKNPPS